MTLSAAAAHEPILLDSALSGKYQFVAAITVTNVQGEQLIAITCRSEEALVDAVQPHFFELHSRRTRTHARSAA
jgi:hypothetical protein